MEDLAQLEPIRPLFSVIISCYNSRKTIGRLLESLCKQNLNYEELEVIIADDCSTESYNDIVQLYLNKLMIKEVKTEYNCCPGNTREAGLQAASGEWICFSDHDDEFIETSLQVLKDKIQNELNERYYIVTGFINQNQYRENHSIKEVQASETSGWTHGKFYNLDNLIKPFNLHFKKDLLSHEDIYWTTNVNCVMEYLHNSSLDAGVYLNDLFTYVWYSHPGSLSHQYTNGVGFLENHFLDYCQATGEVYLECYKKQLITWTRVKECLMDTVLLYYFYSISFIFNNPNNYLSNNFTYITEFLRVLKETFNITNTDIWMWASDNHCSHFKEAERYSDIGTGGCIPCMSLSDWLKWLGPSDPLMTSIVSPYQTTKEVIKDDYDCD